MPRRPSPPVGALGRFVAAEMTRQGLTAPALALALGLGDGSRHMVYDILANRTKMPLARLDLLAGALGAPVIDVLRLYLQQYEPQLYPKVKGAAL